MNEKGTSVDSIEPTIHHFVCCCCDTGKTYKMSKLPLVTLSGDPKPLLLEVIHPEVDRICNSCRSKNHFEYSTSLQAEKDYFNAKFNEKQTETTTTSNTNQADTMAEVQTLSTPSSPPRENTLAAVDTEMVENGECSNSKTKLKIDDVIPPIKFRRKVKSKPQKFNSPSLSLSQVHENVNNANNFNNRLLELETNFESMRVLAIELAETQVTLNRDVNKEFTSLQECYEKYLKPLPDFMKFSEDVVVWYCQYSYRTKASLYVTLAVIRRFFGVTTGQLRIVWNGALLEFELNSIIPPGEYVLEIPNDIQLPYEPAILKFYQEDITEKIDEPDFFPPENIYDGLVSVKQCLEGLVTELNANPM